MSEVAEITQQDLENARQEGIQTAHQRAAEIAAMGKRYQCEDIARAAIEKGTSLEDFKVEVMDNMRNKPIDSSDIGLSDKEAQEFSFMRAINYLANPLDGGAREAAAFELECSRAYGDKIGVDAKGIYVPAEVQRSQNTGSSADGGALVPTNLATGSFIELLRNRMLTLQMGAQMLTGLSGNVEIPKQTGGASVYWVGEETDVDETGAAFDKVDLAPKTMGAFTDISRRLMLQSSMDVEALIRRDLAFALALELDFVALFGQGSANKPNGVANTSGVGSVEFGADGGALTYAKVIELWADIANSNADIGTLGAITNTKVIGQALQTLKSAGVSGYICPSFPDASGMTNLAGLRTGVTNQVPSNLVKGTSGAICSGLVHGNWSDLIIGQWGTLDLTVDKAALARQGGTRVIALQDVDVAVRHPESFTVATDIRTDL